MRNKDIPDNILTVNFFKSESGNEPVREWLKSLNQDCRKAIGEDIKTVQFGWPIGMPVVRKLDTGLWEIRSNIKDGIARIIFTVIDHSIILLHSFIKKSDKTPQDELDTAKNRKKNLLQKVNHEIKK